MEQLNIKVHQRKERVQPRILFDDDGWDTPEDQIQAENEVVYHCCEDDCDDGCRCDNGNCGGIKAVVAEEITADADVIQAVPAVKLAAKPAAADVTAIAIAAVIVIAIVTVI